MAIRSLVRLLRPKQWTKNFLVFAAFIFTAGWSDPRNGVLVMIAFACLCLVSSASYCLNDYLDADSDRLHPKKQFRPIASGAVSRNMGLGVGLFCLFSGVGLSLLLPAGATVGISVFAVIQVSYNLFAKRQPILDILWISLAFVQRAVVGALTLSVGVSGWLLFCTGTLALFLASSKRRQEFISLGSESGTRTTLAAYSRPVLDGLVWMSAGLATMSYGIYAIESETALAHPGLIFTVPLVFFGVLRYLLIVFSTTEGEEPETALFSDPQMVSVLIAFILTALCAVADVIPNFVLQNP